MKHNRLQKYFYDYAHDHQTPGNQTCHAIGVPMIMISLLGLLGRVPLLGDDPALVRMDLGMVLIVGAVIWYFILNWKLAFLFAPFVFIAYVSGRLLGPSTLWFFFVLGWAIQYVGHYRYEKKAPAFYRSVEHLFIGPLWLFARFFHLKY